MRKVLRLEYTEKEGNLIKYINSLKIGIRNKYPDYNIVKIGIEPNEDITWISIYFRLEKEL